MKKKFLVGLFTAIAVLCIGGTCMVSAAENQDDAGVVVEENEDSSTGYTVSFTYYNDDAEKVQIKGGFQFYHDGDEKVYAGGYNLEEGDSADNYYTAPQDWKQGENLVHVGDEGYVADMTKDEETGAWTYSLDLPGGNYLYVYNVYSDADDLENYDTVSDPANLPECNELGANQVRSEFYVPYLEDKQDTADDWTWTLPLEKEEDRGTVEGFTYIGLDGQEMNGEIYLPAGYDANREEPYKVLYLSHGAGGDEADWFYQGHAANIIDHLIEEGKCEDFVAVTMNNSIYPNPSGSYWIDWDVQKCTDNIMNYLLPYVESNYNVSKDAHERAFAGLSAGAVVTGNLLAQDPSAFEYFGLFSCSATYAWPELDNYDDYKNTNIYLAGGWADMCVDNKENYGSEEDVMVNSFADKLDECGITYNNGKGVYIVPGSHDWFIWPQILKEYVSTTLWK